MKFGREGPNESNVFQVQQGLPTQPPVMPPGMGQSPGAIRNTLGSGLKSNGFFQKDGHIQNMRGGFIGQKQAGAPGVPAYPAQGYPSQGYPSQGYSAQGYSQTPGTWNPQAGFDRGLPANPGPAPQAWPGLGAAPASGSTGKGPFSFLGSAGGMGGMPQARQLILQPAAEGITGNGVATISPDHTFIMVANLPPPSFFQVGGPGGRGAVYAAYLVDKKGQNGFLAGTLSPAGSGVYRAQFRSQVPLAPYERVVVSVETPQLLGQVPNGPIILKVKEPAGPVAFLTPVKNTAGSLWGRITGLFKGKAKVPLPGPETLAPEPVLSPGAGEIVGGAGLAGPALGENILNQ